MACVGGGAETIEITVPFAPRWLGGDDQTTTRHVFVQSPLDMVDVGGRYTKAKVAGTKAEGADRTDQRSGVGTIGYRVGTMVRCDEVGWTIRMAKIGKNNKRSGKKLLSSAPATWCIWVHTEPGVTQRDEGRKDAYRRGPILKFFCSTLSRAIATVFHPKIRINTASHSDERKRACGRKKYSETRRGERLLALPQSAAVQGT